MKAITYDRYGPPDVLELQDVAMPQIGENDVLVRVRAASLNPYDWHLVTGLPHAARPDLGLRRPKVSGVGVDLAGQVVSVGRQVTRLRPGDEVFGWVDELPGTKLFSSGSVAEYVRVSQDSVRPLPAGVTHEQAAATPLAASTALQGLQDAGRLQPGQRVLINGASGGVGTFAVQIAAALGAEVTGVCSTRNVDLIRSLGAHHVVDYTVEDVTHGEEHYNLVLDNVGSHSPTAFRRILRPGATYVASFGQPEHRWLGPLAQMLRMILLDRFVSQRMILLRQQRRNEDLDALSQLMETGQVTPFVDRTYALPATREAMDYLATNHARGKVVITT